MFDGAVRAFAVATTLIVAVAFLAFATDQVRDAESARDAETAVASGPPADTGGVRGALDDAAGALTWPFAGVAESRSQWVEHIVPTVLALLFYGLGLTFLARWLRSRG